MSDDIARCSLCGEPMPPGEQMFKYHGLSGPCPKPPIKQPVRKALIEYLHSESDGQFLLEIVADGQPWQKIAFDSAGERQRAHDDLLSMMRNQGARDASAPGHA